MVNVLKFTHSREAQQPKILNIAIHFETDFSKWFYNVWLIIHG